MHSVLKGEIILRLKKYGWDLCSQYLDPKSDFNMIKINFIKHKTSGIQIVLCCSTFKPLEEAQVKRIKLSDIRYYGYQKVW